MYVLCIYIGILSIVKSPRVLNKLVSDWPLTALLLEAVLGSHGLVMSIEEPDKQG